MNVFSSVFVEICNKRLFLEIRGEEIFLNFVMKVLEFFINLFFYTQQLIKIISFIIFLLKLFFYLIPEQNIETLEIS